MFTKIAIVAVSVIVLIALACGMLVYRFPMAVFNWSNRRALKSAGFVESQLATPFGQQTVWEKGTGEPLVFLHGAGDHAGSWSKVAPEFTSKYHVIIPDLAGHASSAPADGTLEIPTILGAVTAVIDAKAVNQKVVIVGNSLGAWIATLYGQQHPERVARLVLSSGGPLRGDRADLAHLPQNRDEAAKLFDAVLDAGSPHPADFVLDDVVRQSQRGPMARLARGDMQRYLLDAPLAINVPVDLVWGESDRLVGMDYAQRMQAAIAGARLTTVPRCGHVPQQECPKTYTRVLTQVLEQTPPQPAPAAALVQGAK